jgi:hypothetical protein
VDDCKDLGTLPSYTTVKRPPPDAPSSLVKPSPVASNVRAEMLECEVVSLRHEFHEHVARLTAEAAAMAEKLVRMAAAGRIG